MKARAHATPRNTKKQAVAVQSLSYVAIALLIDIAWITLLRIRGMLSIKGRKLISLLVYGREAIKRWKTEEICLRLKGSNYFWMIWKIEGTISENGHERDCALRNWLRVSMIIGEIFWEGSVQRLTFKKNWETLRTILLYFYLFVLLEVTEK